MVRQLSDADCEEIMLKFRARQEAKNQPYPPRMGLTA